MKKNWGGESRDTFPLNEVLTMCRFQWARISTQSSDICKQITIKILN
jgi:hypothetical protein